MEQSIYYFLFLFLIYLFVNSEVAITRIFGEFSDATTDGHTTNTYGTVLQALLLVFLYFMVVQIGNYIWADDSDDEDEPPTKKSLVTSAKEWLKSLKS